MLYDTEDIQVRKNVSFTRFILCIVRSGQEIFIFLLSSSLSKCQSFIHSLFTHLSNSTNSEKQIHLPTRYYAHKSPSRPIDLRRLVSTKGIYDPNSFFFFLGRERFKLRLLFGKLRIQEEHVRNIDEVEFHSISFHPLLCIPASRLNNMLDILSFSFLTTTLDYCVHVVR